MKTKIAIVGATGLVGRTMVSVLNQRLPKAQLKLYASPKSAGTNLQFGEQKIAVVEFKKEKFDFDVDFVLLAAGSSISSELAPLCRQKKVTVIDNSSFWRMHQDIPLIVPEVNAKALNRHNFIIANPNCSTIQSVVAINPLFKTFGVKRIIYNTYQSVSGAGQLAMQLLQSGQKYAHDIIPQIDSFLEDGYTKEEKKMINETQKIFDADIAITATAARVPVFFGHCVSATVELKSNANLNDIIEAFQREKSISLMGSNDYPTPKFVQGKDQVFVGRVRMDTSKKNSVNMWIVADNIRKGAATNAVQILQTILQINQNPGVNYASI
ncbi:MAG: aspartate-semialdehyde dehydrogenase [Clostridiales bacterium]|jgi:aspartate-semialdehyde dehydrogenase|nr:aspartate-semialdehyde dehydrogenase [Clostridiales bacterium]